MSHEIVKLACEKLTELEKMKLAQYLIQTSVQTMEKGNPKPQVIESVSPTRAQIVEDVQGRVLKSRPNKVSSMKNFVRAMFQFQGGISDSEIDIILNHLKKNKVFKVDGTKILYL